MPKTFRRRSHRRAPGPTAKWLVLGRPATPILHEGRRAHLQLVRSRDHRKRYAPGQRIAVKEFVPGPTACHIIITSVNGPASPEPYTLGQLDYQAARALGYVRLDDFQIDWVERHDPNWVTRYDGTDDDYPAAALQRFQRRWAHKLAWLLHFHLDITAAPRLLAAQSDELYVDNPAMALPDELPALREDEWHTHIGPQSAYRRREHEQARKLERQALQWPDRLAAAKATAKAKGYDIRDETRRFDRLIHNGQTAKAMRQLELIEQRVYPLAA